MPDDTAIRKALRESTGWSAQSLSNKTKAVRDLHLMSKQHSLYVVAYQNDIQLEGFGVDPTTLIEVGQLARAVSSGALPPSTPSPNQPPTAYASNGPSRAQMFASRGLHERVTRSSKKAFNSGLGQDAVRKAFQSVNNRAKSLGNWTGNDGKAMMGTLFREPPNQTLQVSDLVDGADFDEHNGLRFLMQGAMLGIRNPRSHHDEWEHDDDDQAVLELLGFASWLHRCLDRAEVFASNS